MILRGNWPSHQGILGLLADTTLETDRQIFLIARRNFIIPCFYSRAFLYTQMRQQLVVFSFIPRKKICLTIQYQRSVWVRLLHILLCLYCPLQYHTCCVFGNSMMPLELCYFGDQLNPLQLIYPLSIRIFSSKIRKKNNNGCSNVLMSLQAFGVLTFFMLPPHCFLQ